MQKSFLLASLKNHISMTTNSVTMATRNSLNDKTKNMADQWIFKQSSCTLDTVKKDFGCLEIPFSARFFAVFVFKIDQVIS